MPHEFDGYGTRSLLSKLYYHALLDSDNDPVGAVVLWNAMYHRDLEEGYMPRVPTFNQRWARGDWWKE